MELPVEVPICHILHSSVDMNSLEDSLFASHDFSRPEKFA